MFPDFIIFGGILGFSFLISSTLYVVLTRYGIDINNNIDSDSDSDTDFEIEIIEKKNI
jgi:hypothetical protein